MNVFNQLLTSQPIFSGLEAYLNDPYRNSTSLLLQGNEFKDVSVNNLSMTLTGNTSLSSNSKWGYGSIAFAGSGGRIEIANNPLLNLGAGDYTLESWVYPQRFNSYQHMAGKGSGVVAGTYAFGIQSNVFVFASSGVYMQSVSAVAINAWTHIALSRKNGVLRMFVNGILDSSKASTESLTNAFSFTVGDRRVGDPHLQYPLLGMMEQLKVTVGVGRYVANFTPSLTTFSS